MSELTQTSSSAERTLPFSPIVRGRLLSTVLFIYGLAITVTLISFWGRAVVSDVGLLTRAAEQAAASEVIANQIEQWVADELTRIPGVDAERAGELSAGVASEPTLSEALDRLVGAVVVAAATPGGAEVDVADTLAPAVPEVTSLLAQRGVEIPAEAVAVFVAGISPLQIGDTESEPPVGAESSSARSLTVASVVGLVFLAAAAAAAMYLSEDRRKMGRDLSARLAWSSVAFALIFRLGSWIVDPSGGNAPVRSAARTLLSAKSGVFIVAAAVSGAAAWVSTRTLVKRAATSR